MECFEFKTILNGIYIVEALAIPGGCRKKQLPSLCRSSMNNREMEKEKGRGEMGLKEEKT